MTIFRVALLQMASYGADVDANRRKGDAWCRQASARGADLALFPEMWSHGYTLPDPSEPAAVERWRASALAPDGPFVAHFAALARELGLAIAITYLERREPQPRNALALFDRHGRRALDYAKVHTCDFDREALLMPGDSFRVATLDSASGPVAIGAMICYDREFPESARVLMLGGAEIILVPNACEMELNRSGQLRARAFENMAGIALANYAGPPDEGHSQAVDGMAFDAAGARDMTLVAAGAAEGIHLASFDLVALRHYRAAEVWGDAYRKPGRYTPLVAGPAMPPFVRADSRRG